MRAWLPYPLFSIALFLMWLLLNQSVAPGSIVVGVFLSALLGWVLVKLQPTRSRLHRLGLMGSLAFAVAADIVRSNVAVAGIILRARGRPANTGFMSVDVDLENENALALPWLWRVSTRPIPSSSASRCASRTATAATRSRSRPRRRSPP